MNPQLQTLKRKNSLRGARVLITAIAIFLGSFLITGMARADVPKDPIPDVGGFLAPDDDVMKAELKAMNKRTISLSKVSEAKDKAVEKLTKDLEKRDATISALQDVVTALRKKIGY